MMYWQGGRPWNEQEVPQFSPDLIRRSCMVELPRCSRQQANRCLIFESEGACCVFLSRTSRTGPTAALFRPC